jgi:hypothetical protein
MAGAAGSRPVVTVSCPIIGVATLSVKGPPRPTGRPERGNGDDPGGPTPANLVDTIIDSNSSYTLVNGSITTAINTPSESLTSSLRAMGEFTGGLTPPGTPLPDDNNPNGDAEYAGGIGIASGICLCTGAASDTDVAGENLGSERGVGAEGPNNGAFGVHPGEIGIVVLGQSNLQQGQDFIDRDFDEHEFDAWAENVEQQGSVTG